MDWWAHYSAVAVAAASAGDDVPDAAASNAVADVVKHVASQAMELG